MAEDSFDAVPAGEGLAAETGDPWSGLLSRVGEEPASEGAAADELAPQQDEPPRAGEDARMRSSSLRVRLAVAVVLSLLSAALAGILLPALVGGDSEPGPHRAPVSGSAQAQRASERAIRPWHRSQRGAGRRRARREHAALKTRAGRHLALRRAGPPAPTPAEPESPGTVLPPAPPAPEPNAPSPPQPAQPRGETGLADGSRSSAEFGL